MLEKEYDGFLRKTADRRPVHTVVPGIAVDPAAMVPVTAIKPKSVGRRIARVDLSTANAHTRHPARLGADRARYAGRLWEGAGGSRKRCPGLPPPPAVAESQPGA